MPTEPEPVAQVNTGMRVVDATGAEIGTVDAVQMPGTAGTVTDVDPAVADRLLRTGYVRVDAGLLSRALYVEAGQVAEVAEAEGGLVTLNVTRDALTTAS